MKKFEYEHVEMDNIFHQEGWKSLNSKRINNKLKRGGISK
jgi:hypothetical protein